MKHKLLNDYSEGCHPEILKRLAETNLLQQNGYGADEYSLRAESKIKTYCGKPNADIHFVVGGTLANLLVISSILKPYESVIAVFSGHINTHEAGAVEATGHKIETVKTKDGKLTAADIAPFLEKFPKYHTVKPRLVYISNTTELGTIYTKAELTRLYTFCRLNNLFLFIDGARMAMALSDELSLADVADNCDVFLIGGTKNGALCGEAIVIVNQSLQEDFKYNIKQRGAMLAKGRFLGVQFDVLFENGLYFQLAERTKSLVGKMVENFHELGYKFLAKPESNQIFPILPNYVIAELQNDFEFFLWQKIDAENSAVRLVLSWATPEEIVDIFINKLRSISNV